jgi:hypothetical protein
MAESGARGGVDLGGFGRCGIGGEGWVDGWLVKRRPCDAVAPWLVRSPGRASGLAPSVTGAEVGRYASSHGNTEACTDPPVRQCVTLRGVSMPVVAPARIRLAIATSLILVACGSPTAPVADGEWGSEQASLTLTRAGGTLMYQCGEGTIDSTWTLGANGRFTGRGVHFFGGGPAPITGRTPNAAEYSAVVEERVLTLTVTLRATGVTLGPYRLVRGNTGRVGPVCL